MIVWDLNSTRPLRRVLGRWDLTWLCVVAITNLNVVPIVASGGAGTIWLWLVALAFFFWPQGLAVIELSKRLPGEGGIYLWAKESFGDFHGFMCGWCYWTTNMFFIPTLLFYLVGVSAFAIGKQAVALGESRLFFFLLTLGLLWLTVILNIRGMGVGKWVNNVGGIGTLITAVVLIGLSLHSWIRHGSNLSAASFSLGAFDWRLVSSFGVICFALVGLELGPVMGDEIRDPHQTVPKAVLWGGLISGALYVGATFSLLLAEPQQEIAVVQGVLQALAKLTARVGLEWLLPVLGLLMCLSIAGATSAWLAGSARMLFVSGLDRYLPRGLGAVHSRYATPYVALLAQGVLCSSIVSMSFIGATVREAYVTMLDLAVIMQMISYFYLYAVLLRVADRKKLWLAAASGLVTTTLAFIVAFVPSRQITSIWLFELKMALGCIVFLGLAAFLFRYYSRRKAEESLVEASVAI